jgi:EAL domain-containing protein (putative c-di-GMP-specific phosphodiesterase class I)/CheY-like chemotaxis protein
VHSELVFELHTETVMIPIEQSAAKMWVTPVVAARRRQTAIHAGRVLVADDDATLRRLFTAILETRGYEVTPVRDGLELVERLGSGEPYDAIVSDVSMPNLDGIAALKAIRQRQLELPVIFVTGHGAVESAMSALEHGAFRYLLKPVDPEILLEVVGKAVHWNRLSRLDREARGEVSRTAEGGSSSFGRALETVWTAMQPIVSWSGKGVFGYEALARTEEPGLCDPVRLFDAAERLGQVAPLGRIIRRTVAESMASLPVDKTVFINVHATDLEDPELFAADGVLTPFAQRVVLELTERGELHYVPGLNARIAQLRRLGYRIALDDLGTGYAGFSGMAELEPDVVKVDKSLVRGVDTCPLKQKLFKSLVTLCEQLGVVLISEGVETAAERDCLVSLGGDLLQGYLFGNPGRPFPRVEF